MSASDLPRCSVEEARDFIAATWGITATVTPLNGERDRNFLITATPTSHDVAVPTRYVFKVANAAEDAALLRCQDQVFERLQDDASIHAIRSVVSPRGHSIEVFTDSRGNSHHCRLTTFLEGTLLADVGPRSQALHVSLGEVVARTGRALQGVDDALLTRPLLWDMTQGHKVCRRFMPLLEDDGMRALVQRFVDGFEELVLPLAATLPMGVIHNDANDNNVIVEESGPWEQKVTGLIDFGDMLVGWYVSDLAIACAYAMLDADQPLDVAADITRGYNDIRPLSDDEVGILFPLLAMRLCMSVSICAHQSAGQPDNPYLSVSEQPAWRLLENLARVPPRYATCLLRSACGLEPVPGAATVVTWLAEQRQTEGAIASVVDLDLSSASLLVLDTSVSSPDLSPLDLRNTQGDHDPSRMARWIQRALEDAEADAAIGRYDEYRLLYSSADFVDFSGHTRTLHLGIDIYMDAGSSVYAALAGTVHSVANHSVALDYGGTVILRHATDGENDGGEGEAHSRTFYTLYGHLDPDSISALEKDATINPGQLLGVMGSPAVNGNWPPHLHFEIITDLLGYADTFVGVGSHAHREVWQSLCPDPAGLLGIPNSLLATKRSDHERDAGRLIGRRQQSLSSALSTSYHTPILLGRGVGQYLYDYTGRRYLDAVNNVTHVGHCHPHVVEAVSRAARVLNTNTRYLYPGLTRYAERLLAYLPSSLEVVFLVNSGSEANDLALRLARKHTGATDAVVLDHAYHGNLGSLVDLSPYKHNGRGGEGAPHWVHTLPLPDRLRYRQADGQRPGDETFLVHNIDAAKKVFQRAGSVAATFAESISGCGGQMLLPPGYLASVFELTRAHGGLCVADEVQTGFGRVGSHFWAFETHGVTPDIVTVGKPAGNGHPLAAVITSRAVASSFVTGMEYFNTFGGNPVSCAAGEAVLDVIETEGLQQRALDTGLYLLERLRVLEDAFPLVAEVRGAGLFCGVELVNDRATMSPAADQAGYIAERMKQSGVLISTDGPMHNVLKIKPPMVFDRDDADTLVARLGEVLNEKWARGE